jgi:ABC-2 type transport system permease protein
LEAPAESLLTGLAIVALLGASFSALSYGMALKLKSEDAFAPLRNGVIVPVLLLFGILLPMSLAPVGYSLANLNP